MQTKLIGYIKSSELNEENVFVKIPVFSREEKLFIQKSDLISNKITGFQEISRIHIEPIFYENETEIEKGSDSIFIVKYKTECFVGNKLNADRKITVYIKEKDLSQMNLFSLYTFLGLRKKIVETVESIIIEHPKMNLSYKNFIIPEPIEIGSFSITKDVYTNVFNSFSNLFYELPDLNYTEIIHHSKTYKSPASSIIEMGIFTFSSNQMIAALSTILIREPLNFTDIKRNDFTIGLLIFAKIDLPKNIQIFKYFPFELMQSSEYMNNEVIANIGDLQIRSSTNYYRFDPDAATGSESLVYLSQRLDREFENTIPLEIEVSTEEVKENQAIMNHIIECNSI